MTDSPKVAREEGYDWGPELGEGTFAVVKRAQHKETGVVYAIKVIEKNFLKKNNKAREVVFREREILNVLGNGSTLVVTLHSTFQNPESLFFVMDFCENGELHGWLRKFGGRFPLDVARRYTAETVLALEYVHSKGVMHRDLKPENILLDSAFHIKLIDFGTSKHVGRERSGSFEGTPEFMSPELLIKNEADVRTDLWALGVMVFQMVAGTLPFRGETPWATMERVREREFAFPDGMDADARDFIDRLLNPDPDARLGGGEAGYAEIKQHPFLAAIDWDRLLSEPAPALVPPEPEPRPATAAAAPQQPPEPTAEPAPVTSSISGGAWAKHLRPGEVLVKSGLVNKKRRALNVKKRMLLLIDGPDGAKLLYIDPGDGEAKGSVELKEISKIELKSKSSFFLHTKERVYMFEDKSRGADDWKTKIENLRK